MGGVLVSSFRARIVDIRAASEFIPLELPKLNPSSEIMTQVVDTDLSELKALILSSREEMRSGFAGIDLKFANVNTQFVRLEAQIENLDTRLTGRIDNLDAKFTGEIKTVNTSIQALDTKFTGEIKTVNVSIQALDTKFEERTKNFNDRLSGKNLAVTNLITGLTVTTVGGLLLVLYKFLFFGKI